MAHRMTPARRAALRKAQLASARKRRKGGVRSVARKVVGQRIQSLQASRTLRKTRTKRKPKTKRKKYTKDSSKWASNPELMPIKHWAPEDRALYMSGRKKKRKRR